jgi:hypothetical protein
MRWKRGVAHLMELAQQAAELPSSFSPFRVVELWAVGELLGAPRDLEVIEVAVVVDLPEVPWLTEPVGAQHWANATRASRNPIVLFWRSAAAPVWNHHIERPVLVWSAAEGIVEPARVALAAGTAELLRPPAPTGPELDERLAGELSVSLAALRRCSEVYGERRWAPSKLTPLSDALWRAGAGYLELLDARARPGARES